MSFSLIQFFKWSQTLTLVFCSFLSISQHGQSIFVYRITYLFSFSIGYQWPIPKKNNYWAGKHRERIFPAGRWRHLPGSVSPSSAWFPLFAFCFCSPQQQYWWLSHCLGWVSSCSTDLVVDSFRIALEMRASGGRKSPASSSKRFWLCFWGDSFGNSSIIQQIYNNGKVKVSDTSLEFHKPKSKHLLIMFNSMENFSKDNSLLLKSRQCGREDYAFHLMGLWCGIVELRKYKFIP